MSSVRIGFLSKKLLSVKNAKNLERKNLKRTAEISKEQQKSQKNLKVHRTLTKIDKNLPKDYNYMLD